MTSEINYDMSIELEAAFHYLKDEEKLKTRLDALGQVDLASVNTPTHGEEPALHLACRIGNEAAVKVLLNYHHVTDKPLDSQIVAYAVQGKNTALHWAAWNGCEAVLRLLLNELQTQPRLVDIVNKSRQTPLHFAVDRGNIGAAWLLLSYKATVDAVDSHGNTLLHFAAKSGVEALEFVQEVSANLEMNRSNHEGMTALHKAAESGNLGSVDWLLDHGAELKLGEKTSSPLELAAEHGHVDVVVRLMSKGGTAGLKNTKTVLDILYEKKQHSTKEFQQLVEKMSTEGLNLIFASDKMANYVAGYGSRKTNEVLVSMYRRYEGGQWTVHSKRLLNYAAEKGNKDAIEPLLDLGKSLDRMDQLESALHTALLNNQIDFAETLVNVFSHKERREHLKDWIDRLKTKLLNGKEEALKNLIKGTEKWRTIEKELESGEVPLAFLLFWAENGKAAVNFLAKQEGIWPSLIKDKDEHGRNALHWAAILGKRDILAYLCNIEECKNIPWAVEMDKSKRTPHMYTFECISQNYSRTAATASQNHSRTAATASQNHSRTAATAATDEARKEADEARKEVDEARKKVEEAWKMQKEMVVLREDVKNHLDILYRDRTLFIEGLGQLS